MQRMALGSSVRPCMRRCTAKRNLFQEKNHLDTSTPALPLLALARALSRHKAPQYSSLSGAKLSPATGLPGI